MRYGEDIHNIGKLRSFQRKRPPGAANLVFADIDRDDQGLGMPSLRNNFSIVGNGAIIRRRSGTVFSAVKRLRKGDERPRAGEP